MVDELAEIVSLSVRLVQFPSRAGEDSPQPIIDFLAHWLESRDVEVRKLVNSDGGSVGAWVRLDFDKPGPILCLNACIDTAPFGDERQWAQHPLSGDIRDGWLWGRGSADSKFAAALLMQLAVSFTRAPEPSGSIHFLWDADEHTGHFGGVRRYLEDFARSPDAVVLGYPGHNDLVIGARGFLRLRVFVRGIAAHSGSLTRRGINAITKAAQLITRLNNLPLPMPCSPAGLPPSLTVTEIAGGAGFSQVPDVVAVNIDVRLTEEFLAPDALGILRAEIKKVDDAWQDRETELEVIEHWPAYVIRPDHEIVRSFLKAGQSVFERTLETTICGPSNIGNLLATRGIPTICGLGVGYENLHGVNERACLADASKVWETYRRASARFLRL